jgi:aspartyl/glutamyl-tRNA(Asn/Gln) amidotransferase C subunit
MTQLTEKDIANLANLSKLEMTADEAQKYLKDINGILGYVSQIEKVEIADADIGNTENYNFHTMLRDDIVQDENCTSCKSKSQRYNNAKCAKQVK